MTAETIRGVSELVSADCLAARTEAIASFEGLGPPDLCLLRKCVKTAWAGGASRSRDGPSAGAGQGGASGSGSAAGGAAAAPAAAAAAAGGGQRPGQRAGGGEELSFFHYVIGLEVAGASSAATYIEDLVAAQERGPWMSWLFGGQNWDINGGGYCCYDAFSRLDVRVDVRKGAASATAYAVDGDGLRLQLNRDIWEGAQLSALLRALQKPPRVPGLRALPLFARGPGPLEALVRLSTRRFAWGDRLEGGSTEFSCGTHPLCQLFCGYLVNSRRTQLVLEVLPSLQSLYPAVAIHIARAYAKRGQTEAALNVLVRAARDDPEEAALVHCQAKVLLRERGPGAESLAVAAAEHAVRLLPSVWKFWVTLGQAYLQAGRFAECLAALNSPAVTMAGNEELQQHLLGLPDFRGAERTMPFSGFRGGLVALRPVAFETLPPQRGAPQFGGYGPGWGLNPGLDDTAIAPGAPGSAGGAAGAAQGAGGAGGAAGGAVIEGEREALQALEGCYGSALTPIESGVYYLLVALYRHLGWDELLQQRSQVFFMQEAGDACDDEGEDELESSEHRSEAGSDRVSAAGFSEFSWLSGRYARKLSRRLCSKFLDRLFEALLTDLNFFKEWCQDQDNPRRTPYHSGALWMQRGALAERLQQPTHAEAAFRLCQARCVCPRASLRLLRIYSSCDRAVEAVAQLAVLCGVASPDAALHDPKPWAPSSGWPDWLFEEAARLVSRFGLAVTHAAAGRLPDCCMGHRFALAELLRAAQDAGVDGCER